MKRDSEKFRFALDAMFQAAMSDGKAFLDVQGGPWHAVMGGYPAREGKHSMPTVCNVMWQAFSEMYGDSVLNSPPRKQGATLKIRYKLPR
jgi:hypothetical protein